MSMSRSVLVLLALIAVGTSASVCTNNTQCAFNEYCDGDDKQCYSCSSCTKNCPKNCACNSNADCPSLLSFCPGIGLACSGCNNVAPIGYEAKKEAACKCSSSAECPTRTSSSPNMPTYCGKKASDTYSFCHNCDACYDPFAVEGSCPSKCIPVYQCKNHSDCAQSQYCGANHQCIGCGPHCYKADPQTPQDKTIDSMCPMKCCDWFGLQYHRDGTPMFYAPCTQGLKGYSFRAGYSAISNNTQGTLCSSTLDTSTGRDVYVIQCSQLSSVFTNCNDDQMHFYAAAFDNTGKLLTQDDVYSNNSLSCNLAGIVGSILLIVLLAIFIPLGLCCLAAILFWCGCITICGRNRSTTTTTTIIQGQNYNSLNAPVYGKV